MAFEKSKFGDAGYTSGTTNVTSNVSNHYGPRPVGGTEGGLKTEGAFNELVINFDESGPIYINNSIPAGAVVTDLILSNVTGTVTAATVGAIDISDADGTVLEYVPITATGVVTVTGPTAGSVIIKYFKVA